MPATIERARRRRLPPPPQSVRAFAADQGLDEDRLALYVDRSLDTYTWNGTRFEDRTARTRSIVARALVDEIEKSLMAQEHYTQFENRLIRKIGIGRPETETGSPALRALDLALETELRIAWNDGLEDAAEQQDVLTVWAALLDERTTPGCIWNHGRPLGELAETIPRHPKCRCWPKVIPHPDSRDPDRAATGAAILDDMRAEREAALGELPADANFAEAVRGPRTRPPAWRGICRRLADDWPQTNEEDHEHESIT